MKKVGVILILGIILLVNTFFVFAEEGDVQFVDPGTTPDSGVYFFERTWEGIQLTFAGSDEDKAKLEAELTAERLSEINSMIQEGNYEGALKAAHEGNEILNDAVNHIGKIEFTEANLDSLQQDGSDFHQLIEIQKNFIENEQYVNDIKETLIEKIESGEIDQETAGDILNEVQEGTASVEIVISEEKDQIIEQTAENSDISSIEVELETQKIEEESGIQEEYKKEVAADEISKLKLAMIEIEQEVIKATEEGRENEANTITVLLENAKLKLQICEAALENGNYGEAYGQFNAAQHLTLNADKLSDKTFSDLSDAEVEQIKEDLGKDGEEIRQEIERVTSRYVEEWENNKDELIERYPDKKEQLEKQFEQSKKAMELTEKLKDDYPIELDKLEADGKTLEEASVILAQRFSDEYRKVYGEEFVPPGFIEFDSSEEVDPGFAIFEPEEGFDGIDPGSVWIDPDDPRFKEYGWKEGGGFIEGHEYADPVSGYKYKFSKDKYEYETPLGEKYEQKYPEGYNPETYSRGDEVYNYKYKTSEGNYEYKYSTTGYEIVNPDGTTEKHSYPTGKYEIVGGGEIEQKPTGFEYKSEDGKATTYDYNPEFKHYVASDGKVYTPGVSSHEEKTYYSGDKKVYSYEGYGETWNYNPDSSSWVSTSGQTYRPSATAGAPVGYEDRGSFTTEQGETWTYNSGTGTWKSSNGEEYSPPPSSYYAYNSESNSYTDPQGNVWTKEENGDWVSSTGGRREFTEGDDSSSFTDPAGKMWSYDSSAGVWNSDSGESYNPYTGTTTDSNGQTTNTYNGGGYSSTAGGNRVTDESGNTWSQGSDGTWTSSSGETQATMGGYSGSTYTGGGGYDAAGNYVGGDYGGYDSSGTYTGGNTWTQGSDGTWTSSSGETSSSSSSTTSSTGDSSTSSSSTTSSTSSGGDSSGGSSGGTGMTISGFGVKDIEKYRLF